MVCSRYDTRCFYYCYRNAVADCVAIQKNLKIFEVVRGSVAEKGLHLLVELFSLLNYRHYFGTAVTAVISHMYIKVYFKIK